MFLVQRKQCSTCIYRADSPLDLNQLEEQVKDPYGGFSGHRVCHHTGKGNEACCAGFWARHKDEFQLGQVAQRMGMVQFVDIDNMKRESNDQSRIPEDPPTNEKAGTNHRRHA